MFPPNALKKWLAALSIASPEIGLVGPLTNNAGNAQRIAIETNLVDLGSDIESSFDEWSRAIDILIREPTNLLWRIQRADFFCVAIRSKVWSKLHGLDLIYGRGYYEDFDFSVRAANAGYSSALTEDSFVYHQGSAVFKTSPEQKQLLRKNKRLLLSRFPNLSIPHRRHDNLTLIQQQLDWIASNHGQTASDGTLSALQARLQLRWQEVQRDLPRSPLKRWLWQRRVNAIRAFFNEST